MPLAVLKMLSLLEENSVEIKYFYKKVILYTSKIFEHCKMCKTCVYTNIYVMGPSALTCDNICKHSSSDLHGFLNVVQKSLEPIGIICHFCALRHTVVFLLLLIGEMLPLNFFLVLSKYWLWCR